MLPAVDVGKSVSRVGGKAQLAAFRSVAGDLKLAYSQFEELESFARFGARLDDDARKTMAHGRRIRGSLKQPEFSPISVPAQIAILLAISAELFDEIPLNRIDEAERAVQQAAEAMPDDLRERLFTADTLKAEDREAITEIARQALGTFFSGGKEEALPAESEAGEPLSEPEEPADPQLAHEAEKNGVSAAAESTKKKSPGPGKKKS